MFRLIYILGLVLMAGLNSRSDRPPPHNVEIERGVLGSILIDDRAMHDLSGMLKPDGGEFFRDSHQCIYRSIAHLYAQGKPFDIFSVAEELRRRDEYEKVGGFEYLSEISSVVPHSANCRYHANIIIEHAKVRRLIEALATSLDGCYERSQTADELVQNAERSVFAVGLDQASTSSISLHDACLNTIVRLNDAAQGIGLGLSTGIERLDAMTGGLFPGQLAILAARPSMGKTSMALGICSHVAMNLNKSVLFASLEMSQEEISERFLIARSGIDGGKCRVPERLTAEDFAQLALAYDHSAALPLEIDDSPVMGVARLASAARRFKARCGLDLLAIDYLQMIDPDNPRESRQEQVAKISRGLKGIARELKIPILACAQLNRLVEARENHTPRMSDLRESGAIEADAHLVMLLHRPEYYDPSDSPGLAQLILGKNRNGAKGTINLRFDGPTMTFSTWVEGTGAVPRELQDGEVF
jgi:replicative DNA helicase